MHNYKKAIVLYTHAIFPEQKTQELNQCNRYILQQTKNKHA